MQLNSTISDWFTLKRRFALATALLLALAAGCGVARPPLRGKLNLSFPELIQQTRTRSFAPFKGHSVTWSGELRLVKRRYITVRVLDTTVTHDLKVHIDGAQHQRLRKMGVGHRVTFTAQLIDYYSGLLGPEAELVMDRLH